MEFTQNARNEVEKRRINKEILNSDVKVIKEIVGAICDLNEELERALKE
jgi:hypothetical protein